VRGRFYHLFQRPTKVLFESCRVLSGGVPRPARAAYLYQPSATQPHSDRSPLQALGYRLRGALACHSGSIPWTLFPPRSQQRVNPLTRRLALHHRLPCSSVAAVVTVGQRYSISKGLPAKPSNRSSRDRLSTGLCALFGLDQVDQPGPA
jgi:hypothetical protein